MTIYIWLPIIIAFIAAIGAVIAAVGSYKAANATKDAAELSLLKDFLDEYASQEMAKHLTFLGNVHSEIKREDIYGKKLEKTFNEYVPAKLDPARRAVKFYFFNIHTLYATEKLSPEIYLAANIKEGLILLFEVVEALDYWLSKRLPDTKFYGDKYKLIATACKFVDHDQNWYKEDAEGPLLPRHPV